MKNKYILVIILSLLLLTGCSSIEIEEYAIIAGIGIDYKDNEYIVTYEVYDDEKGEITSVTSKTISGQGSSVGAAIISTEIKIEEQSFLNHCRIVILSETIINNILKNVIDYLIHDPRMRSLEYILISKGISPKELLENKKKEKVLSLQLYRDIKKNKGVAGIYDNCRFVTIANSIENERRALVVPTITYNNLIEFTGAKIFNCCNYKKEISNEEVLYVQLIDNLVREGLIKLNNKSLYIKDFKCKKSYKNNIMNITFDFSILSYDNMGYDLSNILGQKSLIDDFNTMIKNKTLDILNEYQEKEIDPFGVLDHIYDFHPLVYKKQKNIFAFYRNIKYKINVNTKIITTGFTEKNVG